MVSKKNNKNIEDFHNELSPVVIEMHKNNEIRFTTTSIVGVSSGNYWKPADDLGGDYLYKLFGNNPDQAIEISHNTSKDYQKVIKNYLDNNPDVSNEIKNAGKNWIFDKLSTWSADIIKEGLINKEKINKLEKDFKNIIRRKGDEFFGYAHGNTIGDHIYIGKDEKYYLLGMQIVSRPGRGYYDFLRALDWFLLKSDNQNIGFERIVGWMKQYLKEYDWNEIKLVFALRCVGILGWDMLHRGDMGSGDVETKKKLLLRFICREY